MGKLYQYIEVLKCQLIINHFPKPPDLLFVIALDILPQSQSLSIIPYILLVYLFHLFYFIFCHKAREISIP